MIATIADGMKIRYFQKLIRNLSKVSSNLIITAQDTSLTFRAINQYNSALPIIEFKTDFFDEYRYRYHKPRVSFEVPTINFKYSFSAAFNPTGASFTEITLDLRSQSSQTKEENDFHLLINCIDVYNILHNWSFDVAECLNVVKAVVNMSNVSTTIDCRCDIFEGIKNIFKSTDIVSLRIYNNQSNSTKTKKSKFQMTTESLNSNDSVASILNFELNDKCKMFIDSDNFENNEYIESDEMKLNISLTDLLVGLDLASILSQRVLIYGTSPGFPIILKASMPSLISFDMTIASSSNETSGRESQDTEISSSKKSSEFELAEKTGKVNSQTNPIVYAPSEAEREKYLQNDLW